jgi:hypothetical protein
MTQTKTQNTTQTIRSFSDFKTNTTHLDRLNYPVEIQAAKHFPTKIPMPIIPCFAFSIPQPVSQRPTIGQSPAAAKEASLRITSPIKKP